MITSIIIIIISLLLDGIITNYIPYLVGDLSIFTPLFTLVSIFIIYPLFKKNINKYYILVFITGIIYDLFYTNLLFFNGVLFLIIGYITMNIYKNLEVNYLSVILYIIIVICLYEGITGIILYIFRMVPIDIYRVIYKIIHSIFINIIYGEVLYLIVSKYNIKNKLRIK